MLILLPPSEGKTSPRRGNTLDLYRLSFPSLTEARETILESLVRLCGSSGPAGSVEDAAEGALSAAKTLGLGSTQLDEVRRNAALRTASTARADRVYSGVLYDALDVRTLDPAARRRATSWLAITSSLFGLVRPSDPIPAYRLAGDVTLPGTGGVAAHWRSVLDPVAREAAGRGLVIDLRSSTYAAFWRPAPDLAAKVATVRVLHESDGTRKVVSHFNKATKGRLVRDLLRDGGKPTTPRALAAQLADLGWTVETGTASPRGTQLDVVVSDI